MCSVNTRARYFTRTRPNGFLNPNITPTVVIVHFLTDGLKIRKKIKESCLAPGLHSPSPSRLSAPPIINTLMDSRFNPIAASSCNHSAFRVIRSKGLLLNPMLTLNLARIPFYSSNITLSIPVNPLYAFMQLACLPSHHACIELSKIYKAQYTPPFQFFPGQIPTTNNEDRTHNDTFYTSKTFGECLVSILFS